MGLALESLTGRVGWGVRDIWEAPCGWEQGVHLSAISRKSTVLSNIEEDSLLSPLDSGFDWNIAASFSIVTSRFV